MDHRRGDYIQIEPASHALDGCGLGDTVAYRAPWGDTGKAMITEIIETWDASGHRRTPTVQII